MDDDYHGSADLVTNDDRSGGTAELSRTATGWGGTFEFDTREDAAAWLDLMSLIWDARIQLPEQTERHMRVTGRENRVDVEGDGTPPWEEE